MNLRTARRRALGVALTGSGLTVLLGSLAASAGATTLDGSCSTTGPFRFTPAVGPLQLSPVKSVYRGTGQCDGSVDGQTLPDAGVPAVITFSSTGYGGCATAAYYTKTPLTITLKPKHAKKKVLHATLDGMGYSAVIFTAGTVQGATGGLALANGQVGGNASGPMACLHNQLSVVSLSLQITAIPGNPLIG